MRYYFYFSVSCFVDVSLVKGYSHFKQPNASTFFIKKEGGIYLLFFLDLTVHSDDIDHPDAQVTQVTVVFAQPHVFPNAYTTIFFRPKFRYKMLTALIYGITLMQPISSEPFLYLPLWQSLCTWKNNCPALGHVINNQPLLLKYLYFFCTQFLCTCYFFMSVYFLQNSGPF